MKKQLSRITAVLDPAAAREVIRALRKEGIRHLSTETGRTPILEQTQGLSALLSSRRLRLASDPVEILSFSAEPALENDLISLVAQEARLHIPGMGSVYSEVIEVVEAHPLCSGNEGRPLNLLKPENLYPDLVGISCTVVRGQADFIARAVLESGACVPTITFGIGTGVRDKLGLLRITLPAEKEVLTSVVSRFDVNSLLELMIEAGRLEQIGRGIIYVFPVKQGISNTRITRGTSGHAATMEQIISALDTLKGGMEWRCKETGREGGSPRIFLEGSLNLSIECDEGRGPELVQAALKAGAAGATISRQKALGAATPEPGQTGDHLAPAREVCNLVIRAASLDGIVAGLREAGLLDENTHGRIITHPVPRALRGTA